MRSSGILMHLSSLPSPYGIGSMGKPARDFIDFLKAAGQGYWQLLPICPTSYGDSPYQSFSTYAGNPYFIDLELLEADGLLEWQEYGEVDWESVPEKVNYGVLYEKRYPILRKAAERFLTRIPSDYPEFCANNDYWLGDYARFMAMKHAHGGASWQEWEALSTEEIELRYAEEIRFWKVLQYLFFRQWEELRAYANEQGIRLIGDLPIYVSLDSVDVWAHPELFQLDENRNPKEVAGCPPDGFSADGQLWGNPLFDWEYMENNNYDWWVRRIQYLCKVYDILRIDHFRGFDSYYAIPYGNTTARGGRWKQGPGIGLFRAVEDQIGPQRIIAEDLGYLTESVHQLLKDSGFPGMKVLEFAFDSSDSGCASDYLPHNYPENSVAYTGTHDNETLAGWFDSITKEEQELVRDYLCDHYTPKKYLYRSLNSLVMRSKAALCVIPMQDHLGLDNRYRMNKPSTVGENWKWRLKKGDLTDQLKAEIRGMTRRYGRLNGQ